MNYKNLIVCISQIVASSIVSANKPSFFDVIRSADEIPDHGYKSRSDRPMKFWSDHPQLEEYRQQLLKFRRENQYMMSPMEDGYMNVFISNDNRTLRIQRPIFTDLDTGFYPHEVTTKNLLKLKGLGFPEYLRLSEPEYDRRKGIPIRLTSMQTKKTTMNVPQLLPPFYRKFRYRHWAIRIGSVEIQLTTSVTNGTQVPNIKKQLRKPHAEAGFLISHPYSHAAETIEKHGRQEKWPIDSNAMAYDMSSLENDLACMTHKSDDEIWQIVGKFIASYHREKYHEVFNNCITNSLQMIRALCSSDELNQEFVDAEQRALQYQNTLEWYFKWFATSVEVLHYNRIGGLASEDYILKAKHDAAKASKK